MKGIQAIFLETEGYGRMRNEHRIELRSYSRIWPDVIEGDTAYLLVESKHSCFLQTPKEVQTLVSPTEEPALTCSELPSIQVDIANAKRACWHRHAGHNYISLLLIATQLAI